MPTVLGKVFRFSVRNRVEMEISLGKVIAITSWGLRIQLVNSCEGLSAAVRLLDTVTPQPGGCWLWPQTPRGQRYPSIRFGKKKVGVHRASYMTFCGTIEDGLLVCHRCDTPRCCNPAHLFLGTDAINAADRDSKGRAARLLGESNPASKLTGDMVAEARRLREVGWTYESIAKKFGVHRFGITSAIKGETWGHL